jgi:hypothetical protein
MSHLVTPGISQVRYLATVRPIFRAIAISGSVPQYPPIATTASENRIKTAFQNSIPRITKTAFLALPRPDPTVTESSEFSPESPGMIPSVTPDSSRAPWHAVSFTPKKPSAEEYSALLSDTAPGSRGSFCFTGTACLGTYHCDPEWGSARPSRILLGLKTYCAPPRGLMTRSFSSVISLIA